MPEDSNPNRSCNPAAYAELWSRVGLPGLGISRPGASDLMPGVRGLRPPQQKATPRASVSRPRGLPLDAGPQAPLWQDSRRMISNEKEKLHSWRQNGQPHHCG
ncbi:hypothetical protein CapIbe_011465 [Capra ibex]